MVAGRVPFTVITRLCAHGAGVGLLFGAALLLSNTAGLGQLAGAGRQPATALIFLIGSMFAFGPVVLTTALAIALTEDYDARHPPNG